MIELHPLLSVFQVIAFAAVILAVSVWLQLKEGRRGPAGTFLLAFRALSIAAIALLLLNPVKTSPVQKPKDKSPILVLVDTSHSMTVQDMDGRSRIDAVRKALFDPSVTTALSKKHVPKYFGFATQAAVQNPEILAKPGPVNGSNTFIGDSLAGAVATESGARSGAVLLLSDGRDNGEIGATEVARQMRSRGFPVFTVCVGKETKTKDVSVVMDRSQVFASPNQEVSLGADVVSTGYESVPVTVRFLREGVKVAEKDVDLKTTGHTPVSFTAKEAVRGNYRYSIETVPLPGEVTTANNRASGLLTVGNATTQVLLLEGRPTWEAKFLTEALHSDPSVSVDCIFQLTTSRSFAIKGVTEEDTSAPPAPARNENMGDPPSTQGGSPGGSSGMSKLPETRAAFGKYDVVILGKGVEQLLSVKAASELEAYVSQEGGHVIFLRGQSSAGTDPLADLYPVTWDPTEVHDFRMQVTNEGASNPAFSFGGSDPTAVVQRLPTLISATKVEKEKALSVVLARASGVAAASEPNREMAVLAYLRYGDGLAVSLLGQGLWRWALLPPEMADYSNCYRDFWTQLVRWTVDQSDFLPGQDLVLRTDHYTFSPGETVNLLAFVRGASRAPLSPASITGPDGRTMQVSLSKGNGKQADFVGSFRPKKPGDYVAMISRPGSRGGQVTAPFSVYERREEDMNTSADPGLMGQIAQAGGGKALTLDEIQDLPRLIDEAETWIPSPPEPQSIWDRWEVLAAILGLLSIEWFVRRRLGLV